MFIKNNLPWINVSIVCQCLSITRSCYYDWINNESFSLERNQAKQSLLEPIKLEHLKSRKRYGSTKITE